MVMPSAARPATARAPRAIEEAGAEGVVADPDRLGTLDAGAGGGERDLLADGCAVDAPAVNGERLQSLAERLLDTHVRGLVYEAAGAGRPGARSARGRRSSGRASVTWHMPVEVVTEPDDHAAGSRRCGPWSAASVSAERAGRGSA